MHKLKITGKKKKKVFLTLSVVPDVTFSFSAMSAGEAFLDFFSGRKWEYCSKSCPVHLVPLFYLFVLKD